MTGSDLRSLFSVSGLVRSGVLCYIVENTREVWNMKLLITGGSGFLGRRAAACFGTLGLQVLSPSHGELDITDEASVRSWFREHQPEAVLHTAAISDTGLCQ